VPRFVILEHDVPMLHWDLLIEQNGVLVSWRLRAPLQPGEPFAAEASAPHRLLYLDYEGPVSGGRGVVTRWDGGECIWLESGPEGVRVRLRGQKIAGELILEGRGEEWHGVVSAVAD
jgi:hypothetical protein